MQSFNPCYLGNTIRSMDGAKRKAGVFKVSILVILEIQSDQRQGDLTENEFQMCFNPCYLGNTIRSYKGVLSRCMELSFNPCYLGNTIRSLGSHQLVIR